MKIEQVLYTGKARSTGGRDGDVATENGDLRVKLATPKGLGGSGGPGTNPEELFAAGYSACFIGAMKYIAGQDGTKLSDDLRIEGLVGIGPIADGGFGIAAELRISAPGMDQDALRRLVDRAHGACPYSKATRGNIDVTLTIV